MDTFLTYQFGKGSDYARLFEIQSKILWQSYYSNLLARMQLTTTYSPLFFTFPSSFIMKNMIKFLALNSCNG